MLAGTVPLLIPHGSNSVSKSCGIGSGASGQPYVPNRKRTAVAPQSRKKPSGRYQGLIEALASLGLTVTVAQVEEALGSLPDGGAGLEEPGVIRQVFLELRKKA